MLWVRSTKWVFKGETCQANVYLITPLPEKHFLRCNRYVVPLLWQHTRLVSSCVTIKFRSAIMFRWKLWQELNHHFQYTGTRSVFVFFEVGLLKEKNNLLVPIFQSALMAHISPVSQQVTDRFQPTDELSHRCRDFGGVPCHACGDKTGYFLFLHQTRSDWAGNPRYQPVLGSLWKPVNSRHKICNETQIME